MVVNVSIHGSFSGDEDLVTGISAYCLGSRYNTGTTYSQGHHYDEQFGDILSYHQGSEKPNWR